MDERIILVWFRNDLRVHDNEILLEAIRKADKIVPVYCFDPFYFKTTDFGTLKTGAIRAKFLLESVEELRHSLSVLGGKLIVRMGDPVRVIPELALAYGVNEVYHHREVASEETGISARVEAALWKIKLNLKHFIGHTLYHKEDLPFPIKDIPNVFNVFRKKVERDSEIKACLETPEQIHTPIITDEGTIPTLQDLGLPELPESLYRESLLKGGEIAGLQHMEAYLAGIEFLNAGKVKSLSTMAKFSAWLSMGCLSPRLLYWGLKKASSRRLASDLPANVILELLWRDYFRFMFKKHGNQYFQVQGFKENAPKVAEGQAERFVKWKNAETGIPFVDASMLELNTTGYISIYNRQALASYLVRDLGVNWLWGAAYFEEKLIDYSPAINWGNWANLAGVGNDAKEDRYYNALKLGNDCDPKGDYIKKWIPALSTLPAKLVHAPFELDGEQQELYQIILGKQYPKAIVIPQLKKLEPKLNAVI